MKHDNTSIRALRLLSIGEGITLLALVFVAVPLKHLGGFDLAVSILGPIHGITFLFYIRMVISTAASGLLRSDEAWRLVVVAFIPFGGFVNARWASKKVIADDLPAN
jgi:integral membrane protein